MVNRVPKEEWAEIFDEVWRRFRDFFYVENMHGYDWAALREQYRPLVAHVGHRSDLNYVIGEMIAELNISHAYVGGRRLPAPRPSAGGPARSPLRARRKAGRYRIARIFRGQNEEDAYRSPLTEVGSGRQGRGLRPRDRRRGADGEGQPVPAAPPQGGPARAMTVNSKPTCDGAREITFRPVDTETT